MATAPAPAADSSQSGEQVTDYSDLDPFNLTAAEPRRQELAEIFQHTRRIEHFQNLETLAEYPTGVAKFLKRVSRVRIERLLYRIL